MPAPPQAYGAQQPYGQVPPGQPPTGQASAYSAQAPAYPGQQQPSGGDALSQYAPARRKPATSEVPGPVQTAIRLMYAGFAATVLGALLALPVLGRYNHAATVAQNAAKVAQNAVTRDSLLRLGKSVRAESVRAVNQTNVWHTQNQMAGVMAIVLAADILGLACWAWLAVATRRGNGWTRIAGTVLLAVYSVAALLVVFDTKNDPGAEFTTLLVWALGVATVIPLWSQQAREFFYTWRKR
jgi:hypothetical protein